MRYAGVIALGLTSMIFGVSAVMAEQRKADQGSLSDGVKLPRGYRDWTLISVAQENGKNNDIRAILGNDIAVKAYRQGTRPFPDGSIIVRVAWRYLSSPRNDAFFPSPQSFVAGEPTNVQVSVKDTKRYASTAGWGYGQFENGLPNTDHAVMQSCFACHTKLSKTEPEADLVFTGYAR